MDKITIGPNFFSSSEYLFEKLVEIGQMKLFNLSN